MLFLLVLLSVFPESPQSATRVALYVFSLDSDAGFRDGRLDAFRRQLGGHVESFTMVAYSRDEADVAVQLLGQGELSVELSSSGEPEGYLFRPDEAAAKMWALVHVGGYSRSFAIEGTGGRRMSELAARIGEWIREHASAIRERRPPP